MEKIEVSPELISVFCNKFVDETLEVHSFKGESDTTHTTYGVEGEAMITIGNIELHIKCNIHGWGVRYIDERLPSHFRYCEINNNEVETLDGTNLPITTFIPINKDKVMVNEKFVATQGGGMSFSVIGIPSRSSVTEYTRIPEHERSVYNEMDTKSDFRERFLEIYRLAVKRFNHNTEKYSKYM